MPTTLPPLLIQCIAVSIDDFTGSLYLCPSLDLMMGVQICVLRIFISPTAPFF